jgi:Molybdopterin guanine dinucleotide synthesis protein B
MAIVVVGGSGRGVGKTALVCGLIRALPEWEWTAVKVTTHAHGHPDPIYEQTAAGQGTDTARYLAAGAKRALLVSAEKAGLGEVLEPIVSDHSPARHLIFESNSVLYHLSPDLCLAVAKTLKGEHKPSIEILEKRMDATVALAGHDHVIPAERIHFHLRSLDSVSPPMLAWLRERLREAAR